MAKFSDLLRYQLYECNEHEIPLHQELTYLENFIELQKLRQDHNYIELSLNIEQQQHYPNLSIAPFVLIPFIENAFKHVSKSRERKNWIRMSLRLEQNELHLAIDNSTSGLHSHSSAFIPHSGIGLKNVKRRLDLLYDDKYKLNIERKDATFLVELQIEIS